MATTQIEIPDKLYDKFREVALKYHPYTRSAIKREAYHEALQLYIDKYSNLTPEEELEEDLKAVERENNLDSGL